MARIAVESTRGSLVPTNDPDDVDDAAWFDDVLDDVREDKDELPGSEEDAAAYAFFKTNHPAFDTSDDDTEEGLLVTARGFIARYSNRWGIENGYKQIKQFRVRTTSKEHDNRYFNFAFACVLYNVWRLVDLLVKPALEDDPEYSPRVQATTFLTLASKHIGFDPLDWLTVLLCVRSTRSRCSLLLLVFREFHRTAGVVATR